MSEFTVKESAVRASAAVIIGVMASLEPAENMHISIIADDARVPDNSYLVEPSENVYDFAWKKIGFIDTCEFYLRKIMSQKGKTMTTEEMEKMAKFTDQFFWSYVCSLFHDETEEDFCDWDTTRACESLKKALKIQVCDEQSLLKSARAFRKAHLACVKKAAQRLEIAKHPYIVGSYKGIGLIEEETFTDEELEMHLACAGTYTNTPAIAYVGKETTQIKALHWRNAFGDIVYSQEIYERLNAMLENAPGHYENGTLTVPNADARAVLTMLSTDIRPFILRITSRRPRLRSITS